MRRRNPKQLLSGGTVHLSLGVRSCRLRGAGSLNYVTMRHDVAQQGRCVGVDRQNDANDPKRPFVGAVVQLLKWSYASISYVEMFTNFPGQLRCLATLYPLSPT